MMSTITLQTLASLPRLAFRLATSYQCGQTIYDFPHAKRYAMYPITRIQIVRMLSFIIDHLCTIFSVSMFVVSPNCVSTKPFSYCHQNTVVNKNGRRMLAIIGEHHLRCGKKQNTLIVFISCLS